jgi:hypothetical protein
MSSEESPLHIKWPLRSSSDPMGSLPLQPLCAVFKNQNTQYHEASRTVFFGWIFGKVIGRNNVVWH